MVITSKNSYSVILPCEPTLREAFAGEEIERYLKVVIYDLHPDFIGVDFLIDNGQYVFNEVEDPVGSKMLYENTDIDPIKLFAEHVLNVMGVQ